MKLQFLTVQVIYEADDYRTGKSLLISSLRDKVGAKAAATGMAIIGHEVIEDVWMVKVQDENGRVTFEARNKENGATHVRVTYQRQAVSRKVRL